MEHMSDFSMQDARRLLNTPAGQQLLTLLQQSGGEDLHRAMEQASAGNMEQAKNTLSSLLSDPNIQSLLSQLGGNR